MRMNRRNALALPIAAALVFWIVRTDSFKALWNGELRQKSKDEENLEKEVAQLAAEIVAPSIHGEMAFVGAPTELGGL